MSNRVYGTWVDPETGIRHYVSGVPTSVKAKEGWVGTWMSNALCGRYVQVEPNRAADVIVTCVRCWQRRLRPRPKTSDILRSNTNPCGETMLDESMDVDLAPDIFEIIGTALDKAEPGSLVWASTPKT